MKFSKKEIKDLTFAGIMISLAFSILLSGGFRYLISLNYKLIFLFFISFFTAGIGFLLHELMHKYVAQNYGFYAEFRAFRGMLWLALLLSFFGFIFAAPGAVFIFGNVSREKNGKISIAGPLANIILSALFLFLILVFSADVGLLGYFLKYGLSINAFLALFNLIPVMPFDGAKVLHWNKAAYIFSVVIALALLIASYSF
jgi:Zn-dependent protease